MMACGVFGTCAVTALTAQNTQGVHSVHVPPLPFLAQQIDACLEDIGSHAVKTGMLPTPAVVELVASKIREHKVEQLVVDPVLVSTSGHALAEDSVAKALLRHLTPLATLITPNIPEASALLGGSPIQTIDDMEAAAKALREAAGCQAVLIKGGHLANHKDEDKPAHIQPPSTLPSNTQQEESTLANAPAAKHKQTDAVVDVLFDGRLVHRLARARVDTANTHGTGCTLASAIAAELSKGLPMLQAVDAASQYLHAALWNSKASHIGKGAQRPFNHGWMLADWHRRTFPSYNVEGMAHQTADPKFVRRMLWLYAVTDPDLNQRHGRSLRNAVTAAIAGGATMVQVREKSACGGAFLAEVKSVLPVCRAAGVPLIVNDRVDVALAAGPDVGVHVGQEDIPASEVRQLLGPNRILGVTVKSVEEALRAKQDGADYLGAGAVYASSTKDSGVIGLPGLAKVCTAAAPVPVVAIGGIQTANALEPLRAGAVGVAVVSVLFGADDVQEATRKLSARLQQVEQKSLVA
ncbi:Phosphomethylpyrimidine kinase-domain-containing protein [Dunaliella salina]|uniref:thiamine phosphate synthase n=1 Tax=Dunaliella salina TaxID=3046 RepID=A0ABQ7G3X2_DUNSA|nr:Phosphomethylpyrimidine kinase-domain-containing protein [Dunaliella salina]|eukprot:KAF5829310.1 Phosphomethylpyrimidine kinase-domain-containing protein [Dunaliella salina]